MTEKLMETACARLCLLTHIAWDESMPRPFSRMAVRRMLACGALSGLVLRQTEALPQATYERAEVLLSRTRDALLCMEEYEKQGYRLILPEACPNSKPSWFGFLITCREGVDKNHVVQYLESHGVQTRMLFSGNLIKQPCFDEMRKSHEGYRVVGDLHVTDHIMENSFWIGVYPGMTDAKLDYMAELLKIVFEH